MSALNISCVGKKVQHFCGRVYCRSLGWMPLVSTSPFISKSHSNAWSLSLTHSPTCTHTHRLSGCGRQRERQQTVCIAPIKAADLGEWWLWLCSGSRFICSLGPSVHLFGDGLNWNRRENKLKSLVYLFVFHLHRHELQCICFILLLWKELFGKKVSQT